MTNTTQEELLPCREFDEWLADYAKGYTYSPNVIERMRAAWDASRTPPAEQPAECKTGCPENQVCDYCQGTGGKDKVA